jgi:hypothetical protein
MRYVAFFVLVSLAGSTSAEQQPPSTARTTPTNPVIASKLNTALPLISQQQLNQWLGTWQKRMKLDDWNITVQMLRASQMKPNTIGNSSWDTRIKRATVSVLDPRDYRIPADRIADDIELTIVHELVHVQLAVLPRDPRRAHVEEAVVVKLSEALFNLDRVQRQN